MKIAAEDCLELGARGLPLLRLLATVTATMATATAAAATIAATGGAVGGAVCGALPHSAFNETGAPRRLQLASLQAELRDAL